MTVGVMLDVFAGLCLVGILAVVLAAPMAKQYRRAQVRLRWDGRDQAHPVTFHDNMVRFERKMTELGRAIVQTDTVLRALRPEERRYGPFESAYLNLWAVVYAIRELDAEARERVRDADPVWVALIVAAALLGAGAGIFLEMVVWSLQGNT